MKTQSALLAVMIMAAGTAPILASAADAPVETLESGVKVQKIKTAKGPSPKASDVVKVHYRGTLQNGTEFDSSYKRGEPATFPLSGVIPCLASV
jgi:FKBP-type peptidyl-prolyl cis-trans isomerase FkpA